MAKRLGILALLLLTACMPAAYRRGSRLFEQGDYDQAVNEFTQALQERPEDEDIQTALMRARQHAAQSRVDRALSVGVDRPWTQKRLMNEALKYNPMNRKASEILSVATGKIAEAREVLEAAQALLDEGRVLDAYHKSCALRRFENDDKEFSNERDAIFIAERDRRLHLADTLALALKLDSADAEIKQAADAWDDGMVKAARNAVTGLRALQKDDVETALTSFVDALDLNKEQAVATKHVAATRLAVLKRRLAAARKEVARGQANGYFEGLRILIGAEGLLVGDEDQVGIRSEMKGARKKASDFHIKRAKEALDSDLVMTSVAHCRAANAYLAATVATAASIAEEAINRTKRRLVFNVGLQFKDDVKNGESDGLETSLLAEVQTAIQDAGFANINIVVRESFDEFIKEEERARALSSAGVSPSLR